MRLMPKGLQTSPEHAYVRIPSHHFLPFASRRSVMPLATEVPQATPC